MQAVDQGTVDLAAEKGGEDALFTAGLCHDAQTGLQVISERRIPEAAISQLGPPSHRRDHKIGGEATDGVSEEASEIPAATTPCGAAGRPDTGLRGTESHLRGAGDDKSSLARLDER